MLRLRAGSFIASTLLCLATACGSAKHAPMIPASQLEADAKNAGSGSGAVPPATGTGTTTAAAGSNDKPLMPTDEPPPTLGPISVIAPKAAKASVKVLDAGAKTGRRALTFNVKAGTKQKVNYVLNAAFTAPGGQVTTFPTTVFSGETEIRAVTGDVISYRYVSSAVDVRTTPNQVKAADELRKQMQVLKGLTITGTVDKTGLPGETEYALPSAPEGARNVLQEMLAMFPTWMLMPAAPMGNGATWQATRPFVTNGLTLNVTWDCKLALTATTATITAKATVSAPSQELGDGATMSAVTGTGSFTVEFDPTHLYGKSTSTLEPTFTLSQGGQSAQVGMNFAPQFELPAQ